MNSQLSKKGFKNVYFQNGSNPVFCYRTGVTVYEERLSGGTLSAVGWNGSGYPLNNMTLYPTRLNPGEFAFPYAFEVDADGQTLNKLWEFDSFDSKETETGILCKLVLKNKLRAVKVTVNTLLDGTPVIARWLDIENVSDKPMSLSSISPMAGAVEKISNWKSRYNSTDPSKLFSLGYMDDSRWGMEGQFSWHDLQPGGTFICGRYRRERYRHPMFVLKNNVYGTTFIAQLAWSSGYEFDIDCDNEQYSDDAHHCLVSYKIALDGSKPLIVLEPNETYSTPEVHIGMVNGDLDDAVNSMNAHIRASVFTYPKACGRGNWVETGLGPELVMDITATKHFIDHAAYIGSEIFMIDAGWYCPPGKENEWWGRTGDWDYDKDRYPEGIEWVRDYAHSKGIKFGLWMDSERIGDISKIKIAHPDWVGEFANGEKLNSLIDMANPDAAAWVEGEIARTIENYKLDIYRLDYNIGSDQMFYVKDRDGFKECATLRYYKALYAMYDRLRKRFPNVIFETCAGGGGRTDLGLVKLFSHSWVTDWQKAPRSFFITNGMSLALPPETIDRLLAGQSGHEFASLDFQARLCIMVRPTMNAMYPPDTCMNDQQMDFTKHCVDIYKNFISTFQSTGNIYHHTPAEADVEKCGFGVIELAAEDGGKAAIGVFKMNYAGTPDEIRISPRGLDVSKNYKVTFDNKGNTAVVSGYSLVNDGISVRLVTALTSELILIEAE